MRPLSPIRSPSPINRPRITFNYPPSPLKQQHNNTQILSPTPKQLITPVSNPVCQSKVEKYLIDGDKCSICINTSTHKSVKEGNRYCSSCALLVIKKGVQVARIDLKQQKFYKDFQQKRDKENGISTEKMKSSQDRPSNEIKNKIYEQNFIETKKQAQIPHLQLENLLKESKETQGFMEKLLIKLSDQDSAEEGIKKIYKERKLGLKKHYELIKATIKLSIQKDLEQLQKRQRKSIQCLQDIRSQLTDRIAQLNSVKYRIQNIFDEVSYSSDISKLHTIANQAKQTVIKAISQKTKASQIVSQLSSSEGNESQGDSLNVRLTQEQLQQARREVYDVFTYTLLSGQNQKSETLFSFESKNK